VNNLLQLARTAVQAHATVHNCVVHPCANLWRHPGKRARRKQLTGSSSQKSARRKQLAKVGGLRAEKTWGAPNWNTRTIASFELPEGFRDYVPIVSYIKKSRKFDYFQDELEYVLTKPQWWKLDGVTTHEMYSSFRGIVVLRVLRFGLVHTNPHTEATPFAQQFSGWSDQTNVQTQRLVIQANLPGAAEGLGICAVAIHQ
tara:strand:+ start:1573 stop:2172 length:600 start_codon:yes stop_codon:yes gene_type:complete